MKKRLLMIAAAAILAVTSLAGCSSLNTNAVIIKVNDSEMTADVANFYARYTQAQYETYLGAYMSQNGNMWESEAEEGKTYEESVKESVLENLEKMLVLEQHMEDYNVTLSDDEKKSIADLAKKFDEDNTLESKEKIFSNTDVVERVLTLMAVEYKMTDVIQAEADTKVSDKEAAQKSMDYAFFTYTVESEEDADAADEEDAEMTDEEKAAVKEKAESFATDAKKDSSKFAELAEQAGVEATTDTFDAESTTPDEDLIKAADALKEGEVTDVIETEEGCYVAVLNSLMDKDATQAKKDQIISERQSEHYTEVTDKWLEEADITVNENEWAKISFKDMSVTIKQTEEEPYTDDIQTDDQAEDADDETEASEGTDDEEELLVEPEDTEAAE